MGAVLLGCGGVVWYHFAGHRKRAKTAPVVCIDPGHPSETNSARHWEHGTTELEMNWEMAGRLKDALGRYGIEVVMTKRSRDEFVRNHTRSLIANDADADLALHLHCDAGPGRGFTIYFPNKQGTHEGKTGPPARVIEASRRAAYLLHSGMTGPLSGYVHDRGIRGDSDTLIGRAMGTLCTSAFSEVPTVTVEMVFLTNRHDAEFIKSQGGQRRMAGALAAGVVKYLLANGCVSRDGKLIPKRLVMAEKG
jgi:N-acetylmuramoyl-L-alanine amidase